MQMKKKQYLSPKTKVVRMQQTGIICASFQSNGQTEQYEEGSTEGGY